MTIFDKTSFSLQEIEEFLKDTFYWNIDEANNIVSMIRDQDIRIIPDADMAKIHPLLPLSVRAAIADKRSVGMGWEPVDGKYISDTAGLLVKGVIRFINNENEKCYFENVTSFTMPQYSFDNVRIHGDNLKVRSVLVDGEEVPFVYDAEWRMAAITQSEMDRSFPGWRERYLVAQSLELGIVDIAGHVLNNNQPQLPMISIPDADLTNSHLDSTIAPLNHAM